MATVLLYRVVALQVPRAVIVSVGDELLRGETVDTNKAYLCRELTQRGVTVKRAFTLPDDRTVIAGLLREVRNTVEHVLVSGGIGPTPDDVTRQAAAEACDRDLVYDEVALREYAARRGVELNAGQREMCRLPAGCRLVWCEFPTPPGFIVENICVLPGVPLILQAMWREIAEEYRGVPWHEVQFQTRRGESRWAHLMQRYLEQYPGVTIGSYPQMADHWFVELRVRGHDRPLVERVAREFQEAIENEADRGNELPR